MLSYVFGVKSALCMIENGIIADAGVSVYSQVFYSSYEPL